MKNFKNKRTIILAIILVGLMVLAYKVMFAPASEDIVGVQDLSASQRVETILKEIQGINFDTSVLENQSLKSLRSIETPLISLPVGRVNPFSKL